MTSIDDLFKGTSAATKRKFENPSEYDPSQAYKSAKLSPNSDVKRASHIAVADQDDEDEAGPSLPPDAADRDGDEDGDDEEGRFFGGGLDENAIDAINYLDAQDAEGAIMEERYDIAWLHKTARNFEKKIVKNEELRARFADDAQKFMASEGDLDETIKGLSILSEHPELYEEFVKSESATRLVGLLAHENTDIAIDAIEIISELTDEDVKSLQEQWDVLVGALLESDLLSLLVSNLARLDEKQDADRSGVYHSLSVVENLLSQPTNTEMIGKNTEFLTWLLKRIRQDERPTSQNKLYASEIISILTQSSKPNRRRVIEADGIEIFLQQLAPYRRDDPERGSDEEEYMENVFNCLSVLVEEAQGKTKFVEAEGVELCLLMVRNGSTSKSRALKVLDHACGYAESATPEEDAGGPNRGIPDGHTNGTSSNAKGKDPVEESANNEAAAVCDRLVEARGLKPLFSTFMKTKKHDPETTEHILGLFASLLRSLPGNSDARFRVLAKFLEKDFEKTTKLVAVRREYVSRVAAFDTQLAERKTGLSEAEQAELEATSVVDRLDEGLYCLERIDTILAWLVAEDDGAKKAIVKALAERDESLADVRKTLQSHLNGELEVERAERDMLDALVRFLV
jgi:beta-catenin-like protein 1